MIMPTIQNCPKCGDKFVGSDAIGGLCSQCERATQVIAVPMECPMCQGKEYAGKCPVCQGGGQIIGIKKISKK